MQFAGKHRRRPTASQNPALKFRKKPYVLNHDISDGNSDAISLTKSLGWAGYRSSDNCGDTDEDPDKHDDCRDTKPSKDTPPSFRFLRLGNHITRRTPNSNWTATCILFLPSTEGNLPENIAGRQPRFQSKNLRPQNCRKTRYQHRSVYPPWRCRAFVALTSQAVLNSTLLDAARETIPAFYSDLSLEEETPNTVQHEDRHDQSRADNDKQQTENCNDKYPVAFSRSRWRGRVPAEQFVVANVRLEPERKRIAQPRNYPDQLVAQNLHCAAREQDFRNAASRCVNKRYRRNYCGGYVTDSGKQTDNWI